MAIIIIPKNSYSDDNALKYVFNYVADYSKSIDLIGAQNMLVDYSVEQAMAVNKYFYNNTEKKVIHFIISFALYEDIDPMDAFREGYRICALLPEYQIIFAVHQNTDYLHIHFAMNPVSLKDGHKYYFDYANLSSFVNGVKNILASYGVTSLKINYSDESNNIELPEQLDYRKSDMI